MEYDPINSMIGVHNGTGIPIPSRSDQINHVPAQARQMPTDAARINVLNSAFASKVAVRIEAA